MKRKFCHLTVAGLLIAMLLTLFPTTSFAVGFSSGGAMLSVLEYPSPEEIVFLSECDGVNVSEWYALGSPADLRKLSTLVNNGTTSYLTLRVYMTNSIDMTGESFTPIGSSLQTLTKDQILEIAQTHVH